MAIKRIFQLVSGNKPASTYPSETVSDGWFRVQTMDELLSTEYRQGLIQTLYQLSSIPQVLFDKYVLGPIQRYAHLVQLIPASETHHHSYPGGMLDHGLEIMCYAARLLRKHMLPPGAIPEEQVSAGELWSCGILYAALLHDMAKPLADISIHLKSGSWELWKGPIPSAYRIQYRRDRDYHLHEAMGGLLCNEVLGPDALSWIYTDRDLFAYLMYTISGHLEKAGIVGEIVHQADKTSVSKAMGGDPTRLTAAPVQSLQRKLSDGLRHLFRDGVLPLNGKGAAAYLTEEAIWFVTPRVPRELKSYLLSQGIPGIPSDESRIFDEMLAHGLIMPTADGKAVWTNMQISIGDWETSLALLKAAPSLIWGPDDERPNSLATVTAPGEDAQARTEHPAPSETITTQAVLTDATEPSPAEEPSYSAPPPPVAPGADSIFDDLPEPTVEKPAIAPEKPAPAAQKKQSSRSPDAATAPPAGRDLATQFIDWVKVGLVSRKIKINNAKALVHTVNGTWFLTSPNIFKRFTAEANLQVDWTQVQAGFLKKKLHYKVGPEQVNIVVATVEGQRKNNQLKGILIKDPATFGTPPADNIYLQIKDMEFGDEHDVQ